MSYMFFLGGTLGSLLLWGLIVYREFMHSAARKQKDEAAKRLRFAKSQGYGATSPRKVRRPRQFGNR
jgi:hypothetical protein